MKTKLLGVLIGLVAMTMHSAPLAQALAPAIPPNIITTNARPIIMLNMSRDHQLFYRAYDEFSDLTGDGIPETSYAHSFVYYGYFDSDKCYSYSGTNNRFEPVSSASGRYCSGNWAGNFLNWATMTRMDVVRKVLYGGYRVPSLDTGSQTVLERVNLPTDSHSFAKYYRGPDMAQLTPFADTLTPNKVVAGNGNTSANRRNFFDSASNTLHITSNGTTPAAATTSTCQSLVNAFYLDIVDPDTGTTVPDPRKPSNYHCITHSVVIDTAFTLQAGDQIKVVNSSDATKYMQGVAINVDPGKTWFTMAIRTEGFVNPTNADVSTWTVLNLTATSATICNTTLGNNTNTRDNNSFSHTNTNPPIMRVARGDYQLWNANERWQCYWREEKSAGNGNDSVVTGLGAAPNNPFRDVQGVIVAGSGPDYVVRVTACNSSLIGSEKCKQYPSGNYKPIGLLHENGEENQAEFGLFTGSYAKNNRGGVLRSNVGSFREEVEYLTNGTFKTSARGIVYTIDKLRMFGYDYENGAYLGSIDGTCTYQLGALQNGKCGSWGNPMGTMFIESLRYLGGKAVTTDFDYDEAGSKDSLMGLPHPAWVDPFTRGTDIENTFGKNQCRPINSLNFNASVTSYDSDERSQWAPFATLPTTQSLVTLVNLVGSGESLGTGTWFIGNTGTIANRTCTGKTISALAEVNGLCPDAPSYKGSYALAGAAYWARNNAVRSVTTPQLAANPDAFKVKTFSVALSPGKPKIEIPHPTDSTRKIVLQPSYELKNATTQAVVGNGTLVDFRVIGIPTKTNGKFLIVWEDSEQGGDYDSDVSGILEYQVVGTTVHIFTEVFYEATNQPQGFGYTISGSTTDGAHFHSGIEGYNFTDATNLTITRRDGTAHPNVNASGGCNNCQVDQPASRASYQFSTTGAAGQLPDPLWLAAKWGGFTKVESGSTTPKTYFTAPTTDKSNWDVKKLDGSVGSDGIPDNYFLAIRPSELEKALNAAFKAIISASNTAPALASAQLQQGSLKYVASFDGDDGHGELKAFEVKPDGTFNVAPKWEGHSQLNALSPSERNVITNIGNSTGFQFTWSALTSIRASVFGGTDAAAEARLNWVRGDRTNEAPAGYALRKRNSSSLMGPVVNSNPVVTSKPGADYFGAAFPGYGAFVTAQSARASTIWLGSGDGMLHGFYADTKAGVEVGGNPIISFVPQMIHSRIVDLTNPALPKVQSFVDGTPFTGDVLPTTGVWKTYLFSAMGRGGKGMFALDITNPDDLVQANAATIFKWQFSTADDSSGDLGYNLSQVGSVNRTSEQASPIARMNNGKFAILQPNGVESANGSAALYILFVDGPTSGVWSSPTNYVKLVVDAGPNTGAAKNGLAQPTWIDTNNDGIADYIYAGDLQGNIWKFDVSNANPTQWKVAYANTDGSSKRPLFIATDGTKKLPITSALEYRFHPLGGVILIAGTGRSIAQTDFPDTSGRKDSIFGIWDAPLYTTAPYITDPTKLSDTTKPVGAQSPGLPRGLTELATRTFTRVTLDDTNAANGVVGDGFVTGGAIDWALHKGWYVQLKETSEMIISNPTISKGLVALVSIAPKDATADSCFNSPRAFITFLDPITGLLNKDLFLENTDSVVASKEITDQRVTLANDATNAKCASGEVSCVRVIDPKNDFTIKIANTAGRIYWREIPSLKTR